MPVFFVMGALLCTPKPSFRASAMPNESHQISVQPQMRVCCSGRIRTSKGRLGKGQQRLQAGGLPRYPYFISNSPPPRQDGAVAKRTHFATLQFNQIIVPAEGLEPPNPNGRGFTVPSNCRYAIQAFNCVDRRIRTYDRRINSPLLYLLSYINFYVPVPDRPIRNYQGFSDEVHNPIGSNVFSATWLPPSLELLNGNRTHLINVCLHQLSLHIWYNIFIVEDTRFELVEPLPIRQFSKLLV